MGYRRDDTFTTAGAAMVASKQRIILISQDGGSLDDFVLFIILIIIREMPSATNLVIWLLKGEFAPNELTICEVINEEANGLTKSTIERLF